MTNPYYDHTTYPSTGAAGSSSAMRAELELIEAGFALLPTLATNQGGIVVINAGGTAMTVVAAGTTTQLLMGGGASTPPVWTDYLPVASGGTGRQTSTTAYALLAAGTTATGAHQTLAAGATTEVLVGGGASALPVWTTATGSGAPVRATSPTLVTPALGTPSALVGTNISGTAASLTAGQATAALGLKSATTTVSVSAATAPSANQVLTATNSTTATWVTPSVAVSTGITGLGTGVATALAVNVGSAGAFVTFNGALGTPSSGVITNCTGSPTLTAPALGTPASGALTNCTADGTNAVGFKTIPQLSKSTAYTLVIGDSGYHIFHPSADTTARTWTIPANASVAYPIGTAITFVNQNGAGVITIAITTDTMRLAGAGTTGSRSLAANGTATALKVTSTEWIISGTGLT